MSQGDGDGDAVSAKTTPTKTSRTHSKLRDGVIMCNDAVPRWVKTPEANTAITLTPANRSGGEKGSSGSEGVLRSKSGRMPPMTVLGRGSEVSIRLDSRSVSRVHAGFLLDYYDNWFVVNLSSTYPTTMDGQKLPFLQPVEIANGAELMFNDNGPYVFCALRGGKVMGPPPQKRRNKAQETLSASSGSTSSSSSTLSTSTLSKDDAVKIRCRHILVKHKDSRRPSSWKQETVTRTREEAVSYAKALRQLILAGSFTLQELAETESDCMTHKVGGDVGLFGRGVMHKEFEDVAFALKVGEMSDVVESPSGVHIILRTK